MSTRILSLAAAVILALPSVACMAPTTTESENGKGEGGSLANLGQKSSGTDTNANTNTNTSGGTCAAACTHYLECKGASSADNQSKCIESCKGLGLTASQLAEFEQADCASAIAMVDGPSSGSSGSGSAKGSECNGCVRDGSSCIWLSQSNWGQGPYSGAAAECSSYCCE